jgi:hypothetical protein
MIIETHYKIKNTLTELYSAGGSWPTWTKKGKTWKSLGALKRHIHMIDARRYVVYKNAVIISYEVRIEEKDSVISAMDFIETVMSEYHEKQRKEKEKSDAWWKEQRRKEFEKLKKEFE